MPKAIKSLQGQMLLDPGKLQGSFFHRSVVLICQHSAEGAFGLVLNRDTGHKVGEAILGLMPDTFKDLPLFHGGPVQQQAMSYLLSDSFLPEANVLPNLRLGHSLDTLIDLGDSFSTTQRIKIFAGYAGWAPGQLEDEMRRQTWLVHPASLDLIYDTDPDKLWREIMKSKGGLFGLTADAPEDLSSN